MVAVFDVNTNLAQSLSAEANRLADVYTWSRYMAQYPIRQKLARKMKPNFTSASPNADQDDFLSLEIQLVDGPHDPDLPPPLGGPVVELLATIDQPACSGNIEDVLRQLARVASQVVQSADISDVVDIIAIISQQTRFLSRRLNRVQAVQSRSSQRRVDAVQLGWARSADVLWILDTLHKPKITRHKLRHWADRGLVESRLDESGARFYSVLSVINYLDSQN